MYDRVLLPVDGSKAADAAAGHAIEIAQRMGAQLHIVYVVWTGTPYTGYEAPGLPVHELQKALRDHGQRIVSRIEERARQAGLPDVVATVTEADEVGNAVLAQARSGQADVIVMGTHGRTGVSRWVLGSVAEHVLRQAEIPVMAVHAEDA